MAGRSGHESALFVPNGGPLCSRCRMHRPDRGGQGRPGRGYARPSRPPCDVRRCGRSAMMMYKTPASGGRHPRPWSCPDPSVPALFGVLTASAQGRWEPRWRERGVTRGDYVSSGREYGAGCTVGMCGDYGRTDGARVGRLRPVRRSVWQALSEPCRPHDSAVLTEVGRRVRTRGQRGHLVT